MKKTKIVYWITTAIIGAMMMGSAIADLTLAKMAVSYQQLGFPSYFRIELATAKLIGALLLLAPIKGGIKEWPYIGFAITFISASFAHLSSGDAVPEVILPFIPLAVLGVSYFTFKKHKQLTS